MPRQCAHWLAMTCRNLPGGYVCKNVVPGQIRRWFRIRRKRPCTCKSTAVFSMSLRQTPLQPQARICLLHVIARSKATRQSVSPQKCLTNRCCMGEFVVGSVFAQSIAFRFVLPQELRIATPRRPKVRHAPRRPKASGGEQRSLRAPLPAKGAPLRGPQHWLAMTSINLAGLRISGHKWNVLRFRRGRSLQPLKCLHLSLSHAKTGTRCGAAGSGGGFSHCPGQSHIRPPDWPPAVRPQWPPAAPSDR